MLHRIHAESYIPKVAFEVAAKTGALTALGCVSILLRGPKKTLATIVGALAIACFMKAYDNYVDYNKMGESHPEHAKTCIKRALGWAAAGAALTAAAVAIVILLPIP